MITYPEVGAAAARLDGPYDLAVLPRPDDPSSGALCAAAGVPVRAGFAMPRTAPFLTHPVPSPDVDRPVVRATYDVLAAGLAERAATASGGTARRRCFPPFTTGTRTATEGRR